MAEEGGFPCMGPWHCDGWVNDFLQYYYFDCLVTWIPLMTSSLILWFFLVLIWSRRVALCTMIRWVGITAGWMPVIGESLIGCSYCLRFQLSKVLRISLGG